MNEEIEVYSTEDAPVLDAVSDTESALDSTEIIGTETEVSTENAESETPDRSDQDGSAADVSVLNGPGTETEVVTETETETEITTETETETEVTTETETETETEIMTETETETETEVTTETETETMQIVEVPVPYVVNEENVYDRFIFLLIGFAVIFLILTRLEK